MTVYGCSAQWRQPDSDAHQPINSQPRAPDSSSACQSIIPRICLGLPIGTNVVLHGSKGMASYNCVHAVIIAADHDEARYTIKTFMSQCDHAIRLENVSIINLPSTAPDEVPEELVDIIEQASVITTAKCMPTNSEDNDTQPYSLHLRRGQRRGLGRTLGRQNR